MCFKEFCQLGIKILAAGVTATVVFFGIGKLSKKKKAVNNPNNATEESSSEAATEGNSSRFEPSSEFGNNNRAEFNNYPQQPAESNSVLAGLKKTQDICGKLFAVFQSLTTVVENLTRIFNGGSGYDQPYFNQGNPWCYYNQQPQTVQSDNGTIWTRLSPYIVAAGPNPNFNNNGGGFNNTRNYYSI